MTQYRAPLETFDATADLVETGLAGTLRVRIRDTPGAVDLYGPSPTGITESPAGSTWYAVSLTAPAVSGNYSLIWDKPDGTFLAGEDLVVSPIYAGGAGAGGVSAPCGLWTTGTEVLSCCSDTGLTLSQAAILDPYAQAASEILNTLSGGLFPGACARTTRPCAQGGCGWFYESASCSCVSLSEIDLGPRVRSITRVLRDGVALASSAYVVRDSRWLVATNPLAPWPSCQDLTKPSTSTGTFLVDWVSGADPPRIGVMAANRLACELYKACSPGSCALPPGTVRATRQGVTVEKQMTGGWFGSNGWKTGMLEVDAFLTTYNPKGRTRRPVVLSPGHQRGSVIT